MVLFLGLVTALLILGDAVLYTVLPSQPALLGLTTGSLGLILGGNRLIRVLVSSPLGMLCDRWGRRPVLLLGTVLGVASTAGYVLLSGSGPLLLARLVWGIAWSALMVGGYGIVLDLTPASRRGVVVGVYQWIFFSGAMMATLAGGFLSDQVGLAVTLWGCVGLGLVGVLLAILGVPETRSLGREKLQGVGLRGFMAVLDRDLAAIGFVNFALYLGGNGLLVPTLGYFLNELRLADGFPLGLGVATLTGVLLAAQGILSTSCAPLFGHLSDRVGHRWPFVVSGLVLCAISLLGFAMVPDLSTTLVALGLFALGRGLIPAPLVAWAGDMALAERRGQVMGGFLALGDLGSGLGPVLAYLIVDLWGVRWAYALGALIFAAALVLPAGMMLARRRDS